MRSQSGEYLADETGSVWPSNSMICRPEVKSQMRADLSKDAVTT